MIVLAVLILAVLVSGFAVTYMKYESRKLFTEMEKLRVERDELVVDWSRLQIELATWAEHSRVEDIATEKLSMQMPRVENIVVIGRK
ncbi:MAG: cell division protein FtsL [Gammaproteobacteria bacterium]